MRGLWNDLGAVCRRGWWLIVLFSGTGLIGAAQQVGRALYHSHSWHWPSAWWGLFFFLGWIVAQQLVIRDRRITYERAVEERDEARREPIRHVHEHSVHHSWVATQPSLGEPRFQTQPIPPAPPPLTVGTPGAAASTSPLIRSLIQGSLLKRQNEILERLWRAYVEEKPAAAAMQPRVLPKQWTDRRLAQLGETWRRERYEL